MYDLILKVIFLSFFNLRSRGKSFDISRSVPFFKPSKSFASRTFKGLPAQEVCRWRSSLMMSDYSWQTLRKILGLINGLATFVCRTSVHVALQHSFRCKWLAVIKVVNAEWIWNSNLFFLSPQKASPKAGHFSNFLSFSFNRNLSFHQELLETGF